MKKKILFAGRFPMPIHGAAKMNELYYNSLNKNFNVKRIKINYSESIEEIGKFNLKKSFGIFIIFFKLLYRLIYFRPNLIYFEIAPRGFAFARDSIYVLLCKIFRRKILFSIHARGINEAAGNGIGLKYYKFVFRNTKMILLSKLLYTDASKVIKKRDVYFLGNGIEDEISDKEFDMIIQLRQKVKIINFLFLSNMIEEKGPLDVLRFCKILKDRNIKFKCSFVGAFYSKDFKNKWDRKLKGLGLEKECRYLGAKYGGEKKEILKRANFLIFPTNYSMECYPLVILEAFMYGIPVLTYDTGAIGDIVRKDYLGCVSKEKNIDELFSLFLSLRKGYIDRKKIREYFKRNYTLNIAEKKLNMIIGKVTG